METDTQHDTRTHLLDVAERLFAEHGIKATSLRTITSHADANLAAVHYYFGSKEGLVQAIFARRLDPLNEDRLRRLDACEQTYGEAPPPVEEIIKAYIEPPLKGLRNRESRNFMMLMGRIYNDPSEMHTIVHERFHEVDRRFFNAFNRILPHLTQDELLWRFKFLIGVKVMILLDSMSPDNVSFTHISGDIPLNHVITFLTAGMQAPSSEPSSKERHS